MRKVPALATEEFVGLAHKEAAEFPLHKSPGFLLRRLDSRAASLYEFHTGQTDLTARQFGVLLVLFQSGPRTQTELGNRLYLDRSTLGEMLRRMLERNLISRRVHHRDKRAIEIKLTIAGRRVLLKNAKGAFAAQEALLSALPDYLRPVFVSCMEILANAEFPNQKHGAGEEGGTQI